ncbi:hypothetical protein ACIPSA_29900 [Streptomyces sp. NPDC086549]|uniref:hypothetical protein n=1 Tax=Streptomyces sp. NPDC086549 TaxID=3365752 RepID=UPI003809A349
MTTIVLQDLSSRQESRARFTVARAVANRTYFLSHQSKQAHAAHTATDALMDRLPESKRSDTWLTQEPTARPGAVRADQAELAKAERRLGLSSDVITSGDILDPPPQGSTRPVGAVSLSTGGTVQRKTVVVEGQRGSEWGWFLAWTAVGGCLALGLAALLSVGVALIALAAAVGVFLLRKGHRNAVVGGLAGLALPLFYLAYLNRGGPGNVCHATAGGRACTDEFAPVPFLAVGALLFAAGFAIFLVLDHRHKRTN